MKWEFDNKRPIYLQIVEQIKLMIVSGEYNPGDKLKSVRELAYDAKVNPNTMQKALAELERDNLVFANRTAGRFITDDGDKIQHLKYETAQCKVSDFLRDMNQIGYDTENVINIIKNYNERRQKNE